MYQRVRAYVEKHNMLKKQDKVIVGVSGGADSICLLFMLLELGKELDFSIVAVHVNHGLRGAAEADEMYVREMCREQNVELLVFRENVNEYARLNGCTEEEAGREVRRGIFEKVCLEKRGTKIALAHHENDNVETFLWNLCRGTGFAGLSGIQPVAGKYIHPLLCLKRREIEQYLKDAKIAYCTDETNLADDYTRNRIRNHVIPYLEEHVNRQSASHMAEVIENIRTFHEYMKVEVEKYVKSCVSFKSGKWILDKKEYDDVPEVFRKNVLYEFLAMAAGKKKDLEASHVQILKGLLDKQTGRKGDLPYGLCAMRTYEGLELISKAEETVLEEEPNMQIRVFERTCEMVTFPEKNYTKWFDYDIIKRTVKIRHRESGDYIVIDKNGRTQKLKQYFINNKIPQDLRDKIWLVADGNQIMWIVGYRQNQAYQITDQTTKIMEISFKEEDIRLM